jgi:hypothetical protein
MAEVGQRPFDIPLGDSEVITVDLSDLDPDPSDLLAALEDARCPVWVWTKLAGEYWRTGALDVAEKIGRTARECTCVSFGSVILEVRRLIGSGRVQCSRARARRQVCRPCTHCCRTSRSQGRDVRRKSSWTSRVGILFRSSHTLRVLTDVRIELDDLRSEKSKEFYHDEATQLLNQGDRATMDAGQAANSLLSFLTRGMFSIQNHHNGKLI